MTGNSTEKLNTYMYNLNTAATNTNMNHDISGKKQEIARVIENTKAALSSALRRVELQQAELKTQIEKICNKMIWQISGLFVAIMAGMSAIFWNMLVFALAHK